MQLKRTAIGNAGGVLTAAIVLLLGAGSATAQPAATPTFTGTIEVRVVNLEVVVTAGGDRLSGLGREDFALEIDGREVPIEYFTEVHEGRARPPAAGVAAVPALAAGEPVGTSFLVFIDDFFAIPTHRNRVLRALRDQLPRLAPEDRMAVVAFDGRRLDLLAPWSASREELAAALDAAMERTAYGLRRQSEMRRLGSPAAPPALGFRSGSQTARSSFSTIGFHGAGREAAAELQPGLEVTAQVERAVRAAAATLRGFANVPGRRVMLLLAGGWPVFSTEWARRMPGDSPADVRVVAPRERFEVFEPLVDAANRLGYTLYPVDLQPYAGFRSRSAEFGAPDEGYGDASRRGLLEADSREALVFLAEATGGQAFEGSAGLTALERTAGDVRSYYWLGFTPRWQGDDRVHRVEVKPRRQGLKVRSRAGFADLSRRSEVTLMVEGAQLFDTPLPGEGEVAARLGEPQRAGRGRIRVALRLEIPLDKITMLPAKDGFAAGLELRVAARDLDGETADIPVVDLAIRRPRAPAAGDVEIREIELELRPKPHRLVVALYEPATGHLMSERLELEL